MVVAMSWQMPLSEGLRQLNNRETYEPIPKSLRTKNHLLQKLTYFKMQNEREVNKKGNLFITATSW